MSQVERREALKLMVAAGVTSLAGCPHGPSGPEGSATFDPTLGHDAIERVTAMGPIWETHDPFLFCAHHDDRYPAGNERLGPAASLRGRDIGQDFEGRDGWRMYHGDVVPGFPRHPHRGFETVTVVRTGLLDHSDSLGATARYGGGDVQWLTAGRGINHAEMFPLLEQRGPNPLELFQIWLNLPRASKMVEPRFAMLWASSIPRHVVRDGEGRGTLLTIVAGRHGDVRAPAPPPDSWAAHEEADVAIMTLAMEAGARFQLPEARPETHRSLYVFGGSGLAIGGRTIPAYHRVVVRSHAALALEAKGGPVELLLLQGRPIGEPVARHGPFVMNTAAEIHQAYADYHATAFGGWPWDRHDPVHPHDAGRFARHADGRLDVPA